MKLAQPLLLTIASLALLTTPAFAEKKKIVPPEWVRPDVAPKPFSPGLLVDGTLYISGQTGSDPITGQVPDTFEGEMKQAFDNVGAILKAAGMTFDDVVAVTVYLDDMSLFPRMNAAYKPYFREPLPTRSTVGVAKLATKSHLEITVTAHK